MYVHVDLHIMGMYLIHVHHTVYTLIYWLQVCSLYLPCMQVMTLNQHPPMVKSVHFQGAHVHDTKMHLELF